MVIMLLKEKKKFDDGNINSLLFRKPLKMHLRYIKEKR